MARARGSRRRATERAQPAGVEPGAEPPQRAATEAPTARRRDLALRYEPNPKHKEPWQRGARGSLCPKDADGPALLVSSEVDPKNPGKRFATDGTRAYCGHEHLPQRWHGFPVEWRKVPATIRNGWLAAGSVSRRGIKEYW